jgi:hypothetical protein
MPPLGDFRRSLAAQSSAIRAYNERTRRAESPGPLFAAGALPLPAGLQRHDGASCERVETYQSIQIVKEQHTANTAFCSPVTP